MYTGVFRPWSYIILSHEISINSKTVPRINRKQKWGNRRDSTSIRILPRLDSQGHLLYGKRESTQIKSRNWARQNWLINVDASKTESHTDWETNEWMNEWMNDEVSSIHKLDPLTKFKLYISILYSPDYYYISHKIFLRTYSIESINQS